MRKGHDTSCLSSASSRPALDSNSLSTSSSDTPAVSGTSTQAHKAAPKQAKPKIANVDLRIGSERGCNQADEGEGKKGGGGGRETYVAEIDSRLGVTSPTMTA